MIGLQFYKKLSYNIVNKITLDLLNHVFKPQFTLFKLLDLKQVNRLVAFVDAL